MMLKAPATAAVVVVTAVVIAVEVRQVVLSWTGLSDVLNRHENEGIAAVRYMEAAGVDIGIGSHRFMDIAHPADEIGPEGHAATHSQDEGHDQGQGTESISRVIGFPLFLIIIQ